MYKIRYKPTRDMYVRLLPDWEYDLVYELDASEWCGYAEAVEALLQHGEETPGLLVDTEIVEM